MRFSPTWTLLQSLPLISCNPLPFSPSPRDMPLAICANAPGTLAGTFFNPSTPPPSTFPLSPAHNAPTPWCAPFSKTYILATHLAPSASAPLNAQTVPAIQDVVSKLSATIVDYIAANGDGPVPADPRGGVLYSVGQWGVQLVVQNENHQALSWAVLGRAIAALEEWMAGEGKIGYVAFDIVDGRTKVGAGKVV